MKLGLSIWRGRIAPVFDVSRQIELLDIENNAIRDRVQKALTADNPIGRAGELLQLGVQTLICGAISQPFANLLNAYGIELLAFTSGAVEQVLGAYLANALPDPALTMPGCSPYQTYRRGQQVKGKPAAAAMPRAASKQPSRFKRKDA